MPKRKGSARTAKATAARWEGSGDAGAAAAAAEVLETNAEQHVNVDLCTVFHTSELFDVAGFGTLDVITQARHAHEHPSIVEEGALVKEGTQYVKGFPVGIQ